MPVGRQSAILAGDRQARVELAESPRPFTLCEKLQIFLATWFGYCAVLVIGRSLRWTVVG